VCSLRHRLPAIVVVKVGLMSNPSAGPDGAASLTIGAVAKLTGKSASAIRYYEQIGLLPEPARAAGQRRYDGAVVRTLAVIETAQRAGLALDEVKVLLSASPGDPAAVERLREVASRKLPEIAALIERAVNARTSTSAHYSTSRPCPLAETCGWEYGYPEG
jgi:MerR family transcriptional regulator, redox-sensitive transcriptional activator SoxR